MIVISVLYSASTTAKATACLCAMNIEWNNSKQQEPLPTHWNFEASSSAKTMPPPPLNDGKKRASKDYKANAPLGGIGAISFRREGREETSSRGENLSRKKGIGEKK